MFDESIKKVEEPSIQAYDSLRNMHPQEYGTNAYGHPNYTYHHLIGQTLMYCGDPYFKNEPFEVGAYYRIDSITGKEDGLLKLTNIKTGETQAMDGSFSNSGENNYKWVVVGHYEKMKSLYENKDFVYM